MKKLIIILLIASCSTAPSLEKRVQAFMKDSIVPTFNDPKSYEWVSMETDTLTRDKYDTLLVRKNLEASIKSLEQGGSGWQERTNLYDSLRAIIRSDKGNPKDIMLYSISVKCRAKNAMGGLILNTIKLELDPISNKLTAIQDK
jgi:hypothetical protein